jgi:glycopeptide antibiotics resistance protein
VKLRTLFKSLGLIFIALLLVVMTLPRRIPKDELTTTNLIKKNLEDLFYVSGTIEVIGNFFLLVPLFFILIYVFGKPRSTLSLIICIVLSAGAELLQNSIPGRVSSPRDFLLNSLGAISALVIYQLYLKKASQGKISK